MTRTSDTLLVLDLGLTHAKAVLFAADGRLLGVASRPVTTLRSSAERAEQDPREWWSALCDATRELGGRVPAAIRAVRGISVTAQMHALVCVGASGDWLGRALVLGDRRSVRQATAIEALVGAAAVYRITGTRMDASMPAAKVAWLGEHDRPRHHETAFYTGAKDAIRGHLTGDRLSEPIDACATSLWDIHAERWSDELLAAVGLGTSQLPEVVSPETVAGPLLAGPASELGLAVGIPVVVGAGDDVEVLGCGAVHPGDAVEHIGTTGSILAVTDRPTGDPLMAIERYPHALPGLWVLGGSMTAAGAAIAWLADLRGDATPTDLLASLDDAPGPVPDARATSDVPLFLPSLAGERSPMRDPLARGALVGLGLGTRGDAIARAAFDGVAFAMARILRSVEAIGGDVGELVVSAGGLGVDPRWARRRATIYARPLRIPRNGESTARGAAMLLAAGIGLTSDVRASVGPFVSQSVSIPASSVSEIAGLSTGEARLERMANVLAPLWPLLDRRAVRR